MEIDVLKFLHSKANKGVVVASLSEISKGTELSIRKVRTELAKLVDSGYITPVRRRDSYHNGTKTNEYVLTGQVERQSAKAMEVKSVYCRYVSERAGKQFSPQYSFNGYAKIFQRIATLCEELGLDIHLYVLACFHTFSVNWCFKAFKLPYPPPFALASKKNAQERYDSFMRFIAQYAEPDRIEEKAFEERVVDSIYVWKATGYTKDTDVLITLVENEMLIPEFVACLPFMKPSDLTKLKKPNLNPELINKARKIVDEVAPNK